MSFSKYTGKLLSILFRIIIIIYSIIIILNEPNIFPTYWYILGIIPYSIIYVNTLLKEGWYSKLRLLNDFLFITFILYGKELDILNIIFLSLPLINAPNHSGEKRSPILYVLYTLSFFILNNFVWSWSFIVVVFSLWAINGLSSLRYQYFSNISILNEQIEKFLEKDLQINKTYKIYRGLIASLNSINLILGPKPDIKQIICFRISDNRTFLENSSRFVWSYSIAEDWVTQLMTNKEKYSLLPVPLEVNGNSILNNFFILNKSRNQEYLFVFVFNEAITNRIAIIYLKKILSATTNRISRVIGVENALKEENKKMLQDFRNKYFQIQNAEKAMHFIRNRFNTLDNFIEMSKDNIDGNMDSEDLVMYKTELERLERNYKMLMERVKSILDKSDKPFSATKLENKSINYLFNQTREIWSDYFLDFQADVKIDFNLDEQHIIKINPDGFYILVADWVSNLKKYSHSEEKVIFSETPDSFLITFENKYTKEKKQEIESLKNDFNSKERDKIIQRTSYGVLIMKSILEEMNVKGEIETDQDTLRLILTLKKERNENSSI